MANKKSSFEPVVFFMGAWSPQEDVNCMASQLLMAMLSKNLTLSQQINLRAVDQV